jgi:hypothetical protein
LVDAGFERFDLADLLFIALHEREHFRPQMVEHLSMPEIVLLAS